MASPLSVLRHGGKAVQWTKAFMKMTPLHRHIHNNHRIGTPQRSSKDLLTQMGFESYYNIRSNIESLIQDMSQRPLPNILDPGFLFRYRPTVTKKGNETGNEQYMMNIQYMNLLLAMTCKQLDLIQKLPYIVLLNPKIELTHSLYLKTLESLLSCNYPYDLYDMGKMSQLMTQFLNDHEDTLVTLSQGLQEILANRNPHHNTLSVTEFLNKHLEIRIQMKLLATHYLRLIQQKNHDLHIGILDKEVNLAKLIKHNYDFITDMCHLQYDSTLIPKLTIVTGSEITVSYVSIILEYVLTELLKNSTRATIEKSMQKINGESQDIKVSIFQQANDPNEVSIKISDRGGGIPPEIEPHIFEYSYTTLNKIKEPLTEQDETAGALDHDLSNEDVMMADPGTSEGNNNIAGMGFGLPLTKLYLTLFNGKIDIQNLYGYGTDTYLTLKLPNWPVD